MIICARCACATRAAHKIERADARVYVSLEHHWNVRYYDGPTHSFEGRPFVDYFGARAEGGRGISTGTSRSIRIRKI